MPFSYPEIKTFSGLYLQANSFRVPDGAMEQARNIVVKNDDTIQKLPGNYLYYSAGNSSLAQLFLYKTKLLAAFQTKVSYFTDTGSSPNETGTTTDLSGETVSVTNGRIARSVEANNNLYFTTDNGVLKLENYNSNVFKSGVPQGLDVGLKLANTSIGVIAANTSVSYRVIFGRRDANNNLLLSAPSNVATIFVPAGGTGSTYTSTGSGPYTVTVTNAGHGLITGQDIIVTDVTGSTNVNGTWTVTVTSSSQFTFSVPSNPASGTLNYTFTRNTRLEASKPSEINSAANNYFAQIYRSSQVPGNTATFYDFKLVTEIALSSAQITAGVFFYDDSVDDTLRGAELYTNPNSQEGELQANFRAPLCTDIAFHKNYVFYANCTSRKLINLSVVSAAALSSNDYIEINANSSVRRYVARTGVGNSTVNSQSITSSGGKLVINYTSHGFTDDDAIYVSSITGGTLTAGAYYVVSSGSNSFQIASTVGGTAISFNSETQVEFQGVIHPTEVTGVSWSRSSGIVTVTSTAHDLQTGMSVQVYASTGSPAVVFTSYTVTFIDANNFSFTDGLANSSGTLSYRVNNYMFQLDNSSGSISLELKTTAQGLVKAINRDSLSGFYANYVSTTVPGEITIIAKGFLNSVYIRAKNSTVGNSFLPVLPTSYSSGTQVTAINNDERNVLYVSKVGEPEAVPLLNNFSVGSRDKAILRIVALRDSVIIIKEDGIFRLSGEIIDSFIITVLDSTVLCVATRSVKLLNNEVFLLSNQGVCRVSETAVEIISRRIDDVIQPILGNANIEAQTAAIAYESARLYFLTTILPNSNVAGETYVYNILNGSWTQDDKLIYEGAIGPNDTLYFISTINTVQKERKKQLKTDLSAQNYSVTVVSVSSDLRSAVVSSPSVTPEAGDMIVKNNVISRFDTVTNVSNSNYAVTFTKNTNLAASDALILYKRIVSNIKFSPFHAGEVGRMKQFSQLQIHTRDPQLSKLSISFGGYLFGGSKPQVWSQAATGSASSGGWGTPPWGIFPWGQSETTSLSSGTKASPPIRLYVPRSQQRSTFIQPILQHSEAGEAINIQALGYTVRGYGERVVR